MEKPAFSFMGSLLILFSIAIAFSAFRVNRLGNFNVRPTPKKSGRLIVNGPYRYIRHPMYTALFFAGLGGLCFQFSLLKLIAWCLLILVLALKARHEEHALCLHHPDYAEYRKTNNAFIPWIW